MNGAIFASNSVNTSKIKLEIAYLMIEIWDETIIS